jgi:hypothetical protein
LQSLQITALLLLLLMLLLLLLLLLQHCRLGGGAGQGNHQIMCKQAVASTRSHHQSIQH